MAKAIRNTKVTYPPIHSTRGMKFTPESKAQAFAESFQRQCSLNREADDDVDWEAQVDREAHSIRRQRTDEHIKPASDRELCRIIKRLQPKKAPGIDKIGNKALKEMPKKAIMALLNIINAMLRLAYFPKRWKTAIEVFLPKTNRRSPFPQDYRPISLLPAISKVAETIILERIKDVAQENNALPHEQFGFRPGHSTELQVARLVEFITEGMTRKQSSSMVCLDISKAFDKVWHNGLVYKLRRLNFSTKMIQLIQSFLHKRKSVAKIEEALSDPIALEAGVPQGSVLSPLLYSLYTHDPPRTRHTILALYADDMTVAARSKNCNLTTRYVQEELENLENWLSRWKIKTNPQKTQAIFFTKRKHFPDNNVQQAGVNIDWTNTVKYLGVTMDRSLTWKPHVDSVIAKAMNKFRIMLPLMGKRSKLNNKNKARLYKAIITPTLTYAPAPWCFAADTHLNRLEATQSKILRRMTGAQWYIRNTAIRRDLEVPPIKDTIKRMATKTYANTGNHQNPLVRNATTYNPEDIIRHKRPRMGME